MAVSAVGLVAAAALVLTISPTSAGAQDDTSGAETTSPPPTSSTLPPGCFPPEPVQAVFVGRVDVTDVRTARFAVVQVRSGSLGQFAVEGFVDVDYGEDVRYLVIGDRYLVGAGVDDATGRLASRIREPAPMFGGDQVVGIDDSGEDCPEFEDAMRTLRLDGSTIDSGVLSPMLDDRRGLLGALLLPAAWVLGLLVVLAALRGVLLGVGRGTARLWRGEPLVQTHPAPRTPRPR